MLIKKKLMNQDRTKKVCNYQIKEVNGNYRRWFKRYRKQKSYYVNFNSRRVKEEEKMINFPKFMKVTNT